MRYSGLHSNEVHLRQRCAGTLKGARSDNAFPHAAEAAVDAIAQAPSCGLPVTNPSI